MAVFDAVKAAEAIVAHRARLAADAMHGRESAISGVVLSVERGIVGFRDARFGVTRTLIAPPMIAETLKRSIGKVTVVVDGRDHIIGLIA